MPYATGVFEAYWGQDKDITQDNLLAEIAAAMTTDEIKSELKANGEDLARRGGYGSPTFFVNQTDMYFGNDRMPLINAAMTA